MFQLVDRGASNTQKDVAKPATVVRSSVSVQYPCDLFQGLWY